MSDRMNKINELVKQQLGFILLTEMEWPKETIVTITKVQVSRDLKYARIFVSVLPEGEEHKVLVKLIRARGSLQHLLGGKIEFRSTPKLNFAIDNDSQAALAIDKLLDNLE